jgi:hypothetical protein
MTTASAASVLDVPARFYQDNPPNARRTMEALREMGYDSYASILDIIDNSIDAEAKNIRLSIGEHKGDIIIEIADDGCGMDEATLSEALRLGSDIDRSPTDLGKFGMGLVTASIGLSQRVDVLTKEPEGSVLRGGFDLEQIAAEDKFVKWVEEATPEQTLQFSGEKGTMVRLSKTDRITSRNVTQFANVLRNRIGQVFRKFLTAGTKIEVNGRAAEKIDPLMLNHPGSRLMLETEIDIDGGGAATLRVVELPDLGGAANKAAGIIPQNSGFYIVRNNREIMEAQTFDFYKKHPDFSHFRAELCFDGSMDAQFHTDVRKMFIQPSQSFLDKLRQATQGLITETGREGRRRANTARGEVDHSAAEANIARRGALIPKPKALVERRIKRGRPGTHSKGNGERTRTPHHSDLKTVSGLKVVFNEANHGEQSPFYVVSQEGRAITVTYNRDHPFWRELVEHATETKVIAILDYLVFAMANSELLVPDYASVVKSNINTTLVGLLV